jgi:hypothetical protein
MKLAACASLNQKLSRRKLLRILPGIWALPWPASVEGHSSPAARTDESWGGQSREITYRADALVHLLGVKLFERASVGGGVARLERGDGRLRLQFAAGSEPGRAKGFDRIGYVHEETSTGEDGQQRMSVYGFMTETREQTMAEAARALSKPAGHGEAYTVLEAHGQGGRVDARVFRVETDHRPGWPRWQQALAAVASASPSGAARRTRLELPDGRTVPSFLGAVNGAMRAGSGPGHCVYVYSGQLYELSWRSRIEGPLTRMEANIRNSKTGRRTPFELWFDGSSRDPLPCRFEYQPRGFLKLAFVQTEAGTPAGLREPVTEVKS